ncbi:MAG: MFS transporter [Ornithinimicrobium sp.]
MTDHDRSPDHGPDDGQKAADGRGNTHVAASNLDPTARPNTLLSEDPEASGGSYHTAISGTRARNHPSRAARLGSSVGGGLGRGARAVGHGTSAAGKATYTATRKATHAQGAGKTGLSRLIEIHGLHNAGDTIVAVALAGSLFFQVPTGEARGQVALFLLLTLLPFSVLAPLIGPFLDRFRHGRRWAIGSMMALRAFLCWALAASLDGSLWWQFPAALGILIASKAYNVTRAAATPRLLPDSMTLVSANGRMSMAGVVGAAVAAPIAIAVATMGASWALRLAFVVFAVGTVLAIVLPAEVDSAKGEREVPMRDLASRRGAQSMGVPSAVVTALRANVGLRVVSGFLTIFLAFLFRNNPPQGWDYNYTLLLGAIVAAVGFGSAAGTALGTSVRNLHPVTLVKWLLLIDVAAAVVAAVNFGLTTLVILSFTVGLCQQLGKLALDATIQEHITEDRRTSVFGRSETLIQLSWTLGGALAISLPSIASLGMWVIAGVLFVWLVWVLGSSRGRPVAAGRKVAR